MEHHGTYRTAVDGITDADYLYLKLVGDSRKSGETSLPPAGEGHLLFRRDDGVSVVICCPGFPEPTDAGLMGEYDGVDPIELVEEMHLNGLGHSLCLKDRAYIRVFGQDGRALPVVFRDYADALEYVGGI